MKRFLDRKYREFVHNCIVHPLMFFLPLDVACRMHDKNANWAFGLDRLDELDHKKVVKITISLSLELENQKQ